MEAGSAPVFCGFWGATNMKILVACTIPEAALSELRELGLEVVHEPGLSADALQENLVDVGILIVGKVRVSQDAVAAGKSLQMIVCAGDLTSNIALDEASAAGIFVITRFDLSVIDFQIINVEHNIFGKCTTFL